MSCISPGPPWVVPQHSCFFPQPKPFYTVIGCLELICVKVDGIFEFCFLFLPKISCLSLRLDFLTGIYQSETRNITNHGESNIQVLRLHKVSWKVTGSPTAYHGAPLSPTDCEMFRL